MLFPKNLSIKWKLNLIIVITSILVLLLAWTAFFINYRNQYRQTMINDTSSLAAVMGISCDSALVFEDTQTAAQSLAALSAEHSIVVACIYDKAGKVFAEYLRPGESSDFPKAVPAGDGHFFKDNHLIVYRRIILNNDLIGTIYIKHDLAEMDARFREYVISSLFIMAAAFVLIMLLANYLQRIISEPIFGLTRIAGIISQSKDYSLRAKKSGDDEIGELIDGFNEMVAEIQARDKQLEKQVLQRTAALQKAYEDIQTEMAERKGAEEALWQSEERLKLAFDAAHDGLWDYNLANNTAYYSPRWFTMLGYDPFELPSTFETSFNLIHPDDKKRVQREVALINDQQKEFFETEFRMRSKSGKWCWILSRGKAVERDAAGRALRIVGTHVDITGRKLAAEQIQTSLIEKEILLKEIHHRVKNNLTIITSLLDLQSANITDRQLLETFNECRNRIYSMALIHNILYQSQHFSGVDFKDYIIRLSDSLVKTYAIDHNSVTLNINVKSILLDIDRAINCGLIVNELLSNSLKHAFPNGRKGTICVDFMPEKDNKQVLTISDNGIGLPADIGFESTETLGLKLVGILTDQLDGTIEIKRDKGTKFKIIF